MNFEALQPDIIHAILENDELMGEYDPFKKFKSLGKRPYLHLIPGKYHLRFVGVGYNFVKIVRDKKLYSMSLKDQESLFMTEGKGKALYYNDFISRYAHFCFNLDAVKGERYALKIVEYGNKLQATIIMSALQKQRKYTDSGIEVRLTVKQENRGLKYDCIETVEKILCQEELIALGRSGLDINPENYLAPLHEDQAKKFAERYIPKQEQTA